MCARILVVDDSAFSRRRLRHVLEPLGHSVEEAADGNEALERFYLSVPDLVILDLVMPGMYGAQVLSKIRELNADIPIIVATSDVQEATAQEVRLGGAIALINKPIDAKTLASIVTSALKGEHS